MLFKTIEEFKSFLPIDPETKLSEITTFIENTETSLLIPYLSQTQYDNLNTLYQASAVTPLSVANTELLKKCRKVITPNAIALWAPVGQLHISSAGIRIITSGDMKTAFQWQIEDFIDAMKRQAYEALEVLIDYLEANTATFTLYAASTAHTNAKQYFVNNAKDFSKYFQIKDSRLLYNSLLPVMKRVEDLIVKASLSADLFSAMKTQIAAGTLTAENTTLMAFIQPATVHLTIAKAIQEKSIIMDDNGQISSLTQGVFLSKQGKTPASEARLDALYKSEREAGENYLKDLRDYLNENASASVYPLYFASDNYIDTDEETENFENETDWGTVGFF